MMLRTIGLSLLALSLSIPGLAISPIAGAAPPPPPDLERDWNDGDGPPPPPRERRPPPPPPPPERDWSDADQGLNSARGELDQIITPEYRRRGMRVERMSGGNIRLRLPSEVLFAYDSANISRDFVPVLRDVARIMERRPRLQANIVGHTDSNGSDAYNMDLSLRRAESVAAVLNDEGVENRRLHPSGRGKRDPIASNRTLQGQQMNRRVEILLYRQRR